MTDNSNVSLLHFPWTAALICIHSLGKAVFMCRTTVLHLDGSRASQILHFVDHHLDESQAWVVLDDEDVTLGRDGMMMELVR